MQEIHRSARRQSPVHDHAGDSDRIGIVTTLYRLAYILLRYVDHGDSLSDHWGWPGRWRVWLAWPAARPHLASIRPVTGHGDYLQSSSSGDHVEHQFRVIWIRRYISHL